MPSSSASTRPTAGRGAGSGRSGGGGPASRARTPWRTPVTIEVPVGVHAACAGSSVSWTSVVPSGTAVSPSTAPSVWNGNTGAPSTRTRSCSRSAARMPSCAAGRKPPKSRWRSGNPQRGDIGAAYTRAACRSARATTSSKAPSRSTSPPTTNAGALAAARWSGDVGERVGVARHRADDAVGGHVACGPVPVVDRHRHEHRPARRRGRHVDRAGQGGRHVGGPGRLAGELHVGLAELGRALGEQERLPHQQRPRLLARDDHEGRAVAEGREDVPQPVAHPGRRVQVHQTRTAGGLREPVGHGDRHRLLQREGVAEVVREVPEHRQLRGARVPEDRRDAVLAQHRERGLPDRGHGSSTRSPARYSWYAARSSRPWPQ